MAFPGFSPGAIFPLLFVGYLAIMSTMSTIKERLCEQCRGITLSKIRETEEGNCPKDMTNKLVCNFDPTSGCPLCKLMAKSAVVNHKNAETEARKQLFVNIYKKSDNPNELSIYVHGGACQTLRFGFSLTGMFARVIISSFADSNHLQGPRLRSIYRVVESSIPGRKRPLQLSWIGQITAGQIISNAISEYLAKSYPNPVFPPEF
jgi:hypothetical protein